MIPIPHSAGHRHAVLGAARLSGGPPAGRRSAFTLLELLVALMIVALLATVAISRVARGIARQRISAAARKVDADLRWARRRAIQLGATCTLEFAPAARGYRLVRGVPANLGSELLATGLADEPFSITAMTADFGGDAQLVFDGYGVPDSGGTLLLTLGDYGVTITIDANTGVPDAPVWN